MPRTKSDKINVIQLTEGQKTKIGNELSELYKKYANGEIDDKTLSKLEKQIKSQFNPKMKPDKLGDYLYERLLENDPTVIFEYFQFLLNVAAGEELKFVPDTTEIESQFGGLSFTEVYQELKTLKKTGIAIIPGLNALRDKITIPYNGLEYSVSEYVAEYLVNVNKEKEVDIKAEKLAQLKKSLDEKIIDGKLYTQLKNQIEAGEDVEVPTVKPQLELQIEEEDEEDI